MLNVISTCRDILCVDINVDKRCVDHSTTFDDPDFPAMNMITVTTDGVQKLLQNLNTKKARLVLT